MKLVTALFTLSFAASLMGSEVDSFNGRYGQIQETLPQINIKANQLLAKGVRLANDKALGCDEDALYKVLRKRFRNKYTDEFSKWITSTDELDRIITPIRKSIYRDWKWYQAPVPGGWARWVSDPSASMLLVNGVFIGDDKFEHFFGSGFAYFKKSYLKGKGLRSALKHGHRAETGYMGAVTTGIMSYGDLTANFNGMRFWNHILQKRPDIMGQNIGPYVLCKNSKWEVAKVAPIDLGNYIDDAFDEAINCSAFNGKKLVAKVKARLRELHWDTGNKYSCPMEVSKLRGVWKKYGKLAPYLINVEGIITKPKMSFKEYMKLTPAKVEARTGFKPQ